MTKIKPSAAIFGRAVSDYYHKNQPEDIKTETNISGVDTLPTAYLFRDFEEMPKAEQKAMQLSKGKVLDVGCAAGSHSLYLQNKGLEVHALDISQKAIEICKLRGIIHAYKAALLICDKTIYYTILIL